MSPPPADRCAYGPMPRAGVRTSFLQHNAPQLPQNPELYIGNFELALNSGPCLWSKHFL